MQEGGVCGFRDNFGPIKFIPQKLFVPHVAFFSTPLQTESQQPVENVPGVREATPPEIIVVELNEMMVRLVALFVASPMHRHFMLIARLWVVILPFMVTLWAVCVQL